MPAVPAKRHRSCRLAAAAAPIAWLVIAAGPAPVAVAATAPAWSVQPTVNPADATNSILSGVSCPSQTACTAVGYFTNRAGAGAPLAERWRSGRWSIAPTPRPAGTRADLLFGVSCTSNRACVAVGSTTRRTGQTVPLAERWNGRRWIVERPAGLMTTRHSVSYLGGISCTSPRSCTAVGFSGNSTGTSGAPLVERWDGRSWAAQRDARPPGARVAFLSSVSCTTGRSCVAVGFLIDHSGMGRPLAERWNGARWQIERTPRPQAAVNVQLVGVSCAREGRCMSAGFFSIVTGIEVMLAEHWSGTRWSLERTLYPNGASGVQFGGVSCALRSSCAAVGFYGDASGYDRGLAERWDGRSWSIEPIPRPAGAVGDSLAGVSCTSARVCTAVGTALTAAGSDVTLAERSS